MATHLQQTRAFAKIMAEELTANAENKGPFANWKPTPNHILREMEHHMKKLKKAVRQGAKMSITEYSADLANYAMKMEQQYGYKA